VAREILTDLGADEELVDEVCDIIGHHHQPREPETANFKVLYDADMLVNLEEGQQDSPKGAAELTKRIDRAFLTEGGRSLARKELLAV
jgi:hypothetical protein